ncbi:MAG TPA: hypothetical protein VKT73_13115 [Xanthobacteraceae bacterium]|nr:hypothetical protein [Xanthobacteraceae bacterium]
MKSFLTVNTPASSIDLTTRDAVKGEFGITGTAEDTQLATWITQASAIIAKECNAVFGAEDVTQTFAHVIAFGTQRRGSPELNLLRFPVIEIESLTEDGITLEEDTDFSVDKETGILYRLTGGSVRDWWARDITVTYQGGYSLPGSSPPELARACTIFVRHMRASARRDPLVKSVNVPNVIQRDYWVGPVGQNAALPPEVDALLTEWRRPAFG